MARSAECVVPSDALLARRRHGADARGRGAGVPLGGRATTRAARRCRRARRRRRQQVANWHKPQAARTPAGRHDDGAGHVADARRRQQHPDDAPRAPRSRRRRRQRRLRRHHLRPLPHEDGPRLLAEVDARVRRVAGGGEEHRKGLAGAVQMRRGGLGSSPRPGDGRRSRAAAARAARSAASNLFTHHGGVNGRQQRAEGAEAGGRGGGRDDGVGERLTEHGACQVTAATNTSPPRATGSVA